MSALATANVGRENLFQKTAELGLHDVGLLPPRAPGRAAAELRLRARLPARRRRRPTTRSCAACCCASPARWHRVSPRPSSWRARRRSSSSSTRASTSATSSRCASGRDAYVALMVSVTLVVVVSLVSMMIYSVGTVFILGLATVMIGDRGAGRLDHLSHGAGGTEDASDVPRSRRPRSRCSPSRRSCCPAGAVLGAVVATRLQHRRGHGGGRRHRGACRRHGLHRRPPRRPGRTRTSRRSSARSARSSARSARR